MEFRYSDELSPSTNPTSNLAGTLALRRNHNAAAEERGAARARADWQRHVGLMTGFYGGYAQKYGLMQIAVPECLPDRLEIISYASELGFLYDDHTEFHAQDELETANDTMQATFELSSAHTKSSSPEGLGLVQQKLAEEMIRIDPERAKCALKMWAQFLNESAGRQHKAIHRSFEEYMQYRVKDVGEMFWFGLVTFGMALTIPEHEIERIRDLTRSCWIVLALQNDICSWDKEAKAAREENATHIVNAIWFLMRDYQVDLERAKKLCLSYLAQNLRTYQTIVTGYAEERDDLSLDARKYLQSLLYTISGDAAWSLICPRYNTVQDTTCINTSGIATDWNVVERKCPGGTVEELTAFIS